MVINYRDAVLKDEEELYILTANLATSYKLNKSDFYRTYEDLLIDKNADIFVAERDSRLLDMF
jgi:hypothetical protein